MLHARRPIAENPWVTPPRQPPAPAVTARPSETIAQIAQPQPGVLPPPSEQRLPWRKLTRQELLVPVWLTSAHGGAGSSTLAELSPGWRAAGGAWPISPERERPARVLVCARTSYSGLRAAQAALADWASGRLPIQLEGLVLLAAAPGRAPKPLRPLLELVRSAAGRVWEIGWQPQWLLGPPAMTGDRGLRELVERFNTQPREA